MKLHKYPRTPHLLGSRLQPGDDDLPLVPFNKLRHQELVVEEKLDGANAAISFSGDGDLTLQSRGHFLVGGQRERHFDLFKSWAASRRDELWDILGDRFIMYGEWCYALHTIAYDRLPHYFLEFDIFNRQTGIFLSTLARHDLLRDTNITSVPVLHHGAVRDQETLRGLIGPSRYKSPDWRKTLRAAATARGLDPDRVLTQVDPSDRMEGLYLKVEQDSRVSQRFKWVRSSFQQTVINGGDHWLDRPLLPNGLAPGVTLFLGEDHESVS